MSNRFWFWLCFACCGLNLYSAGVLLQTGKQSDAGWSLGWAFVMLFCAYRHYRREQLEEQQKDQTKKE